MTYLKHKTLKNKTSFGQALVEFIISLPILFTCTIFCLFVFYTYMQKIWVDHVLYQSLICLAQKQPQIRCQKQLKQNLKSFLEVSKIKKITLKGENNKWYGKIVIKNIYGLIISEQKVQL